MPRFAFAARILLVVLAALAGPAGAQIVAQGVMVASGYSARIAVYGSCAMVTNLTGAPIIVPTSSPFEWNRFREAPPAGVTTSACPHTTVSCRAFSPGACWGNVAASLNAVDQAMCQLFCETIGGTRCCHWRLTNRSCFAMTGAKHDNAFPGSYSASCL